MAPGPAQRHGSGVVKVLHVVLSLDPGGTEKVLANVARSLAPRGFDVHVCCLERTGAIAELLPDPSHVTVLGKQPGFSPATVGRLFRTLCRVRPDIVHTHNLGPLIYGAMATGWGCCWRVLHGEHGQLIDSDLAPRRLRLRRRLYGACRKVHTVSEGLLRQLAQAGMPAAKLVAVVNGTDTEMFRPADREECRAGLGLPRAGPMLGIVGRLSRNKRHELLIRALALLASGSSCPRLAIVGDGPERDALEQLSSDLRVSDRVHFAGYLDSPARWYQAMDLFVLPSRQEGLCNAVLEAMACGVPVLGHSACGNAEVINHGVDGWVLPLDSPELLAEEIGKVLADPDALREVGSRARKKIVSQFSFGRTVAGYEALYREVTAPWVG